MRVKRLELQGFKSFKDKTVIHFDHSITGVVGPNGCGKSNIVDAFFWVMGEQSYKHMRGSGSQDLIFNGSSKYQSIGMAEATLVLETDYVDTENAPSGAVSKDLPIHLRSKEVSITRRVYRTGEGEYFINGVPSRLKDIQEFFMDTGVGAKGYSVIEQGQIGKIVNSKPEERRLLVEEAAGIAKYKARKRESLRKMDATKANLGRLTDVIQEIERNLNSLERQAKKAQKYKEFKKELFEKETLWGRRKHFVLTRQIRELKARHQILEAELEGIRAEIQSNENNTESGRGEHLQKTTRAEELQTEVNDLSQELTQIQSYLEISRQRKEDLSQQSLALDSERTELKSTCAKDEESLATQQEELRAAEVELRQAEEKSIEFSQRVGELFEKLKTDRHDLEEKKKRSLSQIEERSRLLSQIASLDGRIESSQAQRNRLLSLREAQTTEADRTRVELNMLREKLAQAEMDRNLALQTLEEIKTSLSTAKGSLKEVSGQAERTSNELQIKKSKLESLLDLDRTYEGLSEGSKHLLSETVRSKWSLVADLVEAKEGFEHLLETWLGQNPDLLWNSGNFEESIQAVRELREKQKGRAIVRLASSRTNADIESVLSQLKEANLDVKGRLADFVKFKNEGLNRIIENVAVVETLPKQLPKFLNGVDVVSMDGLCVSSSGYLSGGSSEIANAGSVLGRKDAIRKLESEVSALEEAASTIKAQLECARTVLQGKEDEFVEANERLKSLEIRFAEVKRDLHQIERALTEKSEQLNSAQTDLETVQSEEASSREKREQLRTELESIETAISSVREEIEASAINLSDLEAKYNDENTKLNELKVELAAKKEKTTSISRETQTARSYLESRKKRLLEVEDTLVKIKEMSNQYVGDDSESKQKIELLNRKIAQKKEELSFAKEDLSQFQSSLNSSLDVIKKLHSDADKRSEELNKVTLDLERNKLDLLHLVQNLEEKYGKDCLSQPEAQVQEEMEEPVFTKEISEEEEQLLNEEVEELRERIRRLGEVNTMAIHEYDELRKRYDHLLTEKNDLEMSLENLDEAISHINKTSKERFKKAFETISDRFERLFPIIFGGGQAKLSLVYPEGSNDILEAGVEIFAQPPGKKVVNIGLLSGGEKALTAVSLIFAIFMVKPSPFCLLDEVDAPLDDSNIGKFNALLKEMSTNTQFILITHNKKTMELNDTLYGVTMEEPGVSKVVSIELN